MQLAPLTSASAVCRNLNALPDVVECVSSFLDCATPKRWSIPRASAHNNLRLLLRVAARESPHADRYYKAHLASQGLVAAVQNDNLEIVRWLCFEYCPSMLPARGIQEAARLGKLHVLQWFFANHESAQWSKQIAFTSIRNGHLDVLQWILPHLEGLEEIGKRLLNIAAAYGHLEITTWIHEQLIRSGFSSHLPRQILLNAIWNGHFEIARFLFDHGCPFAPCSDDRLSVCARYGNLEMVKWVHTLPHAEVITGWINHAAASGHLHIVQWVHENNPNDVCSANAMNHAATNGHLHVVKWLHANRSEGCTTLAMDGAAEEGHLEVVQWLHEHRPEGCTAQAMENAACNGHFHVLKWLHAHRTEGCTADTMDGVMYSGDLEMIKWLHDTYPHGWTPRGMDLAASRGHLHVVQWLHENRTEGCTTAAMDNAARDGHLRVVQWLHENRTEGCTTNAMDCADSLEMVQWLHANRSEGCTARAMEHAAYLGSFETLLFLHANRSEGCTDRTAHCAVVRNWLEIFQWLCAHYPERVDLDAIALTATTAEEQEEREYGDTKRRTRGGDGTVADGGAVQRDDVAHIGAGIALHVLSAVTLRGARLLECFLEEVDARTSDNKILFRFGLLDPKAHDRMDVKIKTPSMKTLQSWNKTQNDHLTATARESGLYHLCFRKLGGSSEKFIVFYSFDFISTGSVSLVLYPNVAATVAKANPDETVYTAMALASVKGEATSLGIVEFDLQGVSSSIIRPNTRVQLLLAVDSVSKEKVDIAFSVYPRQLQYPISWNSLSYFVRGEYKERTIDNAVAEMGSHLAFDITELFSSKVTIQQETLTFALFTNENAEANVFGMTHVTPDYYPQIIVEDLGLDLMREVAYFKETVFTLKGDISYILHSERGSRDAAESANSRVKWLSLLTNIVLVGIAFAQVVYIRSMLEGSY